MSARRLVVAVLAVLSVFTPPAARAQTFPYPSGFRTEEIGTNGTTIHVRIGGSGPAVVLLHGYGDTGDMWAVSYTHLTLPTILRV